MPRPKLSDPSERTLYMRQYREKKMTEAERADREVRKKVLEYSKANPQIRANARRTRRRDVYRARQVVEAGVPLTFKRQMMTVEDALSILRGDGYRQRDLLGPQKPSKQKGVPKKKSYDTPQKLNNKIRQMMLAQGLTPASPDLTPLEKQENPFNINRPINMNKEMEELAKKEAEKRRLFQESLRHQGLLNDQPKQEEEEANPFGDQVFDFSPDK